MRKFNIKRFASYQIEEIKNRCKYEPLKSIGKDIGLNERRVGEIVKHLNIKRRRWARNLKPFEALYHVLINEASRKEKIIELSFEEFLEFTKEQKCHYCSVPLIWSERINRSIEPYIGTNLDRKDNSKGYSKENCVACCDLCNKTRGNKFTYEEFKKIGWSIGLIRSLRTGQITTESSGHIRTFTGKYYEFLNPRIEDIDIIDIAHALAYQCRFVGMTSKFYSVAEHCVRVSYLCSPEYKLWGLMHDAGEAYCADVSRPFKRMPGMNIYRFYEQLASQAICEKFGLNPIEPREVKEADMKMLVTEQRDLMNNAIPDFTVLPVSQSIEPWTSPEEAERRFLMRFYELI